MLKQRIITAVLLLLVLLPALFYSNPLPFIGIAVLAIAAGAWEWSRLNHLAQSRALGIGAILGASLAAFWWVGGVDKVWGAELWAPVSLAWVVLGIWMLKRGVAGWTQWPAAARLVVGLVLLSCAWLALVQAKAHGLPFLLSSLTLVWAADIFAYFGGKSFGRRKLALTISPGKTWEGAISGAIGVFALAFGWIWFDQQGWLAGTSLFTRLMAQGWPVFIGAIALLVAMSVIGDLVESLVKRSAGFKDSSQLLPGHGGVLDRVDALLPVLPIAMWLSGF